MARMIALIILLIPGVIAAYGIKLMRDMFFGLQVSWLPSLALQIFLGLIMFVAGLSFIGGFLLHRDRKKNKVQQRFVKKKQ